MNKYEVIWPHYQLLSSCYRYFSLSMCYCFFTQDKIEKEFTNIVYSQIVIYIYEFCRLVKKNMNLN